ncbi:NUDIX domain-containing protein [Blastococcus sp. VKM Ac-2987]|uniref:NUDIX domain-containing protein n=1 Tax=Blastococcus sp. VKM Ac-2987 TaxID=3004141 RepID=UPI0022ABA0E6|nr:NUDIX hydrolase [Blastococcus sp. VKM Ac-2987]MCZ2861007.1 NUDIX hydrolase [Blastococcus sp. VKM Ac-2987]
MIDEPAPHEYRVLDSAPVYEGRVIRLLKDTVAMPGGGDSVREVVRHPGAVAVVALDDDGHVVLLRQYRHPVGEYLWELPAGLRDADGEPPLQTAQRELAEETRLAAERWSLLTTHYSSPGFCDEMVLIYLAEGLRDVDRPEGFTVEHEELDMTVERVPLADAVQRVFDGGIRNAAAVVGLLAAAQARATGPRLRPVDAG